MKAIVAIVGLTLLLLQGCASVPNQHRFNPVAPVAQPAPAVVEPRQPGAIYQASRDMRLFEGRTARRIGDIVTIQLVERTNASKSASSSAGKSSALSIAAPLTVLGRSITGLETDLGADHSFDGSGSSDQSNSLTGLVSAVVVSVYPNGNLAIRGEKMLTLNQGEEFVQISGVVRPDDISETNTVLSTRVADAQITYAGTGALADANAAGWAARFFLSPLWPF